MPSVLLVPTVTVSEIVFGAERRDGQRNSPTGVFMAPVPRNWPRTRLWVTNWGAPDWGRVIMGYEVPSITGSVKRFHRACCSMKGRMMTAHVGESSAPLDRPQGKQLYVSWKLCMPRESCLRLLAHFMRL